MAMNRQYIKDIFNKHGFGKNGFISLDEFSELCNYFGMDNMTTSELKQLYRNLDTDGDGKVSNNEFMVGMFRKDSLNNTPTNPETQKTDVNGMDASSNKQTKNEVNLGKSLMSDMFSDVKNQNLLATRDDASDWLNYLDLEGTGHVRGADVIDFWEKIGILDGKNILQMLQFDSNGVIQPSDLSHALERELQRPDNELLHKVAIVTLLHSTDKHWNDNIYLVEECQKIKEDTEKIKKDAEDDIKELTQKKDMEIRLLQEANRKLREEPLGGVSLPTTATQNSPTENQDDPRKVQENPEKQLEKTMEECKKLKQRNFFLEREMEKLKADLETADNEISNLGQENEQLSKQLKESKSSSDRQLQAFPSSSLDIDDSMTHDEIKERVKTELARVQRLASVERKDAEDVLLVEISDLEKKHEEKLEKIKADYEKEKAELISAHKRGLEDALAIKEQELLNDFAKSKLDNSSKDISSGWDEKKLQSDKKLEEKDSEIRRLQNELSEQTNRLEELKSKRTPPMKDAAAGSEPEPGELAPGIGVDDAVNPLPSANPKSNTKVEVDLKSSKTESGSADPVGDASSKTPAFPVMVEVSTETEPVSEMSKLQNENYEEKLAALANDLKDFEYKNKDLKEENEKLKVQQAKEVEDKLVALKNGLREVEFKNKDLNEQNEKLKADYDEKIKSLSAKHENDLSTLKKSHANELMSLQEEHEMVETATNQKFEDANKRVNSLTDELSKLDAAIEVLEEKINECEKKIKSQEQELSSKAKELKIKDKEAKDKDERIFDLEKQLEDYSDAQKHTENLIEEGGDGGLDAEGKVEKLRNEYESKMAQLKEFHETEMENLRNDLREQQVVNDPTSRRLTMPIEVNSDEVRPKLMDLIKNFETGTSAPGKVGYKKSLEESNVKAGQVDMTADLKKQFAEEKLQLSQKYNDDLKNEQNTIRHLKETINKMENEKTTLLQTIDENKEKIAKIQDGAKKEKDLLEEKLKSHLEKFPHETPASSNPVEPRSEISSKESARISDVIEEYEVKLESLRKQMEKEREDKKEKHRDQMISTRKNELQNTPARSGQSVMDKSTQMETSNNSVLEDKLAAVSSGYEQQIRDIKIENDQEVSKLRQLFDDRDEELRKNYEDLMNSLKKRKEIEISQLDNTIKNLRKDKSKMRESQQIPAKVNGFELVLKKQVEELAKENANLRGQNLQLQADLDSRRHSENTKADDFQKLMLHVADLNAEKDLIKDQLRRTLEQLNKVTTALTGATSQHRADKEFWASLRKKLIDPVKHEESVNKVTSLEVDNKKLRAILEYNQSEAAKMVISKRESQDKEMKNLFAKIDTTNELAQRLRQALNEKDNIIAQMNEKLIKGDQLAKDLYLENAKLIKGLQQLEKQNLEANSKIQMLEQKCVVLGDLVRKLYPAAVG